MRRVASIAMVHETLSQALQDVVPFDEIADRVLAMCAEVAAPESVGRRCGASGAFGELPAEVATALAMVLTELVQNAVEHAYPDGRGRPHRGARRARRRRCCASWCSTTAPGCRPASTWRPARGSACGSSARSSTASCAARSCSSRAPGGTGTRAALDVPLPDAGPDA